jgi:hypothetical protein
MSMQSSDHSSTYNANISACILSAFVILCSSFCYCKALGDIINIGMTYFVFASITVSYMLGKKFHRW